MCHLKQEHSSDRQRYMHHDHKVDVLQETLQRFKRERGRNEDAVETRVFLGASLPPLVYHGSLFLVDEAPCSGRSFAHSLLPDHHPR